MIGTTLDEIRRYLGDSDNPLRLEFEQAVAKGPGGAKNPEGLGGKSHKGFVIPNVIRNDNPDDDPDVLPIGPPSKPKRDRSNEPQAGTSVGYAARRLGRERPELSTIVDTARRA